MCPNQFMASTLLPDCRISNRVFMYSMLQSLQAEERRSEEVDVQFRDRYEVFRELLSNYPMPLPTHSQEHFQPNTENTIVHVTPNVDDSEIGLNRLRTDCDEFSISSGSANSSFCEEDLSNRCDFFEEAVRNTLDMLGTDENNF